ncbi:MAG: hypothetical protein Q8934_16780 [Bacillota bacterium]|nr:hypothetical protein [Bacillota bacterium]
MKLLNFIFIVLIFAGIVSTVLLINNFIQENKQVVKLPKSYELGKLGNRNFVCNIEQASIENNKLTIKGWGIIKKSRKQGNLNLLLKNSKGELYKLKYKSEDRKDVTKFFNDGFNYNNSGFISEIDLNNINGNGKYVIIIQIEIGKEKFYSIDERLEK